MGRPLAFVIAVVGAMLAVALLDRDRETDPLSAPLAHEAEAEAEDSGGGSLVECISSVTPPASTPPAPPLTPAGVEVIADRVERLRELSFAGPVDVKFLSDAEIDRELSGLIDEELSGGDRELIRQGGEALEVLGALPPGSNLVELNRRALDSQVLGLFVTESGELLVSTRGEPGALEAITVAHELDHALTDESLDSPVPVEASRNDPDGDYAGLALLEGDATLLMTLYLLRYVNADEQLDLLDDPSLSGPDGLGDLPYVMRAQLLFPYDAGLRYVCDRFREGGWEAVDRAYADPPRSTAEILDPEGSSAPLEYFPPPVQLDDFEPGWSKAYDEEIGAAELSWLFEAPGDDRSAAIPAAGEVAAGWRYGHVELWRRGSERALSMQVVGSSPDDPLCGATIAWYRAAFPGAEVGSGAGGTTTFEGARQSAAIRCSGAAVLVGIGPSPSLAESLAS